MRILKEDTFKRLNDEIQRRAKAMAEQQARITALTSANVALEEERDEARHGLDSCRTQFRNLSDKAGEMEGDLQAAREKLHDTIIELNNAHAERDEARAALESKTAEWREAVNKVVVLTDKLQKNAPRKAPAKPRKAVKPPAEPPIPSQVFSG